MNPGLNRDQLIELKELLADRMVDDMSTGAVSYTHLTLPTMLMV